MRKNIILILCDSLRFDHVNEKITPNIMKLAKRGTFYENFHTKATNTLRSIPYILCGQQEFEHEKSIQHMLSNIGYHTVLISTNQFMMADFNGGWRETYYYPELFTRKLPKFIHRILHYLEILFYQHAPQKLRNHVRKSKRNALGGAYLPAGEMLLKAREKIGTIPKPFFLWIHLMDIHLPYIPLKKDYPDDKLVDLHSKVMAQVWNGNEEITENELGEIRKLYRECVQEVDEEIGFLASSLDEETFIVITSDHGEELGEEGYFSHSEERSVPQLNHIPLIISPGPIQRIKKKIYTDQFKSVLGAYLGMNL